MERILLAEDEPTNLVVMAASLRNAGYQVDEVEDGQQAWDMLGSGVSYAVVVTDRQMPNMDGLQLAERMKATPPFRHIPIIMQTASDKPDEVVEGITAGVYYYLTKPFKDETLLALVEAAVRERRQQEWFEQRASRQKEALENLVQGEFHIRRPDEAQNLAFLLGNLFPRPALAVSGLFELMLNAIEHGNLGIKFEEKGKLLGNGEWEAEIARRLTLPLYINRKVSVQFALKPYQLEVMIKDEGQGFDWLPFLEIEPARATQRNGRGIAKANLLSFDSISYYGVGNQVAVASALPARN